MFARTARLTLRPAWPEDVAAIADAVGRCEVTTALSHVPFIHVGVDARDWIGVERRRSDASWLILSHEHDYPRIVGGIGLSRCLREGGQQLGYWLTPEARGRGYATEAGRAVVDAARRALGLQRLTATHWHDNPSSGRVLQKLGFRRTGDADVPCRARGGRVLPCAAYVLDLVERPAPAPTLAEAA